MSTKNVLEETNEELNIDQPEENTSPEAKTEATDVKSAFTTEGPRKPAPSSILTLNADMEIETQESREDTIWHELQNAYRTRKVLVGTLGRSEQTTCIMDCRKKCENTKTRVKPK